MLSLGRGIKSIVTSPTTLLVVFGLLWLAYSYNSAPCRKPLNYRVGEFDERMGVEREVFIKTLKEAEDMWETALGRDVFNYSEDAAFPVNVVYTDLQKKYEALTAYNAEVKAYNDQLAAYNAKVEYWNSQGGAPTPVFNQLQTEKRRLQSKANDLDSRKITADGLITGTEAVGTYESSGINVYLYTTPDHLRITLAHELGHAFVHDHSTDPQSIMYHQEVDVGPKGITITPADVVAAKEACGWDE